MAIDDVWQLQLIQRCASQQIMNSVAFRSKTATAVTQAMALALADNWKDALKTNQVATVSYVSWVLQQLRGGTASYPSGQCRRDGGARLEGTFSGTVVGSNPALGTPPQACVVTSLKTGFSGRRKRGRFYYSGWDKSLQTDGRLTAPFLALLNTLWAGRMAAFGPGGTDTNFEMGIWSMRTATGCVPGTAHPHAMVQLDAGDEAAAYLPITSATVRDIVYSQRRRTIGVGR